MISLRRHYWKIPGRRICVAARGFVRPHGRVTMNFWQRSITAGFGHLTSDERKGYKVQFLLLFILSTLLYVGFPGTREWRRVAEENQMQTIIRGWDGLSWYTWLAAAPFMLLVVQRFPLIRGWRAADLVPLAGACFAIYLSVTHVRYALRIFADSLGIDFWGKLTDFDTYAYNTFAMLPLDFLTFSGFFAVSFAVDAYYKRRYDAQQAVRLQLKAAELQSDLARAELAALRGQLHPHFLFNSFNALATLVRQRKNDAAVEIIAQLSALLRLAIDRSGLHEIPLEQEVDFIRRYLDIEQVRFGDKLRVAFVLEPAALGASVANIVLQPLVENAIKHGISLRTTPGMVRIAAGRSGDRLQVEITNDGPEDLTAPRPAATARKPGIGLANTRAQLDNLYGTDYRLEMTTQPSGVTTVTLNLPWRHAISA
jgi:two-component system LytT family sensor kinase